MAQELSSNLLQLLHSKCRCRCHTTVISGVENSGTDGCTATQCQCGTLVVGNSSSIPSNHLSNVASSFGRVDQNTVFRPIIPSNSDPQQHQEAQEVLSDAFNILSLQSIRTGSLEAQNSSPSLRQAANSLSCSTPITSRQGSSFNGCDSFMTPQDFLNSSNSKSTTASTTILGTDDRYSLSETIPISGTASRSTPLTIEDVTTRFITPDEFLISSQLTTEMQSVPNTQAVSCAKNFVAQGSNLSEFNGTNNARNERNSHTMMSNKQAAQKISDKSSMANGKSNGSSVTSDNSGKIEKSDNPLSEFCSKIGITPDHNQLLPTLPGGENIRRRLNTPEQNELENLRKDLNKEPSETKAEEAKPVNQPIVLLKEMPYRNSDGNKPYIAIFWDIENCHVPRRKDANSIVRLVRDKFCGQHIEYEFYVVMDVHKEKEELSRELLRAQVTVVHVSKGEKNAADEKLVYLMRRYATYHQYGHTCILISGDTNFTPVLHDMRHKHHINIILLHNNNANEQLRNTAHFIYNFSIVTDDAPTRPVPHVPARPQREMVEYHPEAKFLAIHGLPPSVDYRLVKNRLHMLCENLGGKVFQVYGHHAYIDMRDPSSAIRAKNHLDGETVYSHKICCTITNACSLSNFQLACGNGDVQHFCSLIDDPGQQDNRCPQFNSPHYSYNKYVGACNGVSMHQQNYNGGVSFNTPAPIANGVGVYPSNFGGGNGGGSVWNGNTGSAGFHGGCNGVVGQRGAANFGRGAFSNPGDQNVKKNFNGSVGNIGNPIGNGSSSGLSTRQNCGPCGSYDAGPALSFQPFDLLESDDCFGKNFSEVDQCGSPYSSHFNTRSSFNGPSNSARKLFPSRPANCGVVRGQHSSSMLASSSGLYGDYDANE